MSHEQPDKPAHLRVGEVFDLTRQEEASYRVSQERFTAILDDPSTTIHTVCESENNYGEWLFVTVSRQAPQGSVLMSFYGYGFHEQREQWFTDQWFFYQANPFPNVLEQTLSREEAEELLERRLADISPHITCEEPSERGRLFAMIADLTDDDAACVELEDLDQDTWPTPSD